MTYTKCYSELMEIPTFIDRFEYLKLGGMNFSDFSFLKKNKKFKELNLAKCENIKDASFISELEKFENSH